MVEAIVVDGHFCLFKHFSFLEQLKMHWVVINVGDRNFGVSKEFGSVFSCENFVCHVGCMTNAVAFAQKEQVKLQSHNTQFLTSLSSCMQSQCCLLLSWCTRDLVQFALPDSIMVSLNGLTSLTHDNSLHFLISIQPFCACQESFGPIHVHA